MNTLEYRIVASSDGSGGFLPVTLDKSNLGFSPADTYGGVQLSCKGLAGGTYDVWFKPRGCEQAIIFIEGATEIDAVFLENKFVFDAVSVVFNAGVGGAPSLCAAFIKRSF